MTKPACQQIDKKIPKLVNKFGRTKLMKNAKNVHMALQFQLCRKASWGLGVII